jgi:hypothetical protein
VDGLYEKGTVKMGWRARKRNKKELGIASVAVEQSIVWFKI